MLTVPVEPRSGYRPGGYHPVHLGDLFHANRYRILHKLGWGSYGTVWLAWDGQESRYVALKFVAAKSDSVNCREIEILHYLRNTDMSGPNGTHDVLVFDVVGPGPEELRHTDEGENLIWEHAKTIFKQVAMGLEYLHKLGITHGDLHESNIAFSLPDIQQHSESAVMELLGPPCKQVIAEDEDPSLPKYLVAPASFKNYLLEIIVQNTTQLPGNMKIIDFGEALFTAHRPEKIHTPMGIRAPELIFNEISAGAVEQDWGEKIDVWSLGCLIHDIVGEKPLITGYDFDENTDSICTQYLQKVGSLPSRWQPFWSPAKKAPTFRGFERYFKSEWLDDYVKLTGDDLTDFCDLLRHLLVLDPQHRATIRDILRHPWVHGGHH